MNSTSFAARLTALATIGRTCLLRAAQRRHAAELLRAERCDRGYLDEIRHADQRLAALRRACGVVPPPAPRPAPKLVEVYIDFGEDRVPEAWGESKVPPGWRPFSPHYADADGCQRWLVPASGWTWRDLAAQAVAAVEAHLRELGVEAEVIEAVHVVEPTDDWIQRARATRVEVRP